MGLTLTVEIILKKKKHRRKIHLLPDLAWVTVNEVRLYLKCPAILGLGTKQISEVSQALILSKMVASSEKYPLYLPLCKTYFRGPDSYLPLAELFGYQRFMLVHVKQNVYDWPKIKMLEYKLHVFLSCHYIYPILKQRNVLKKQTNTALQLIFTRLVT